MFLTVSELKALRKPSLDTEQTLSPQQEFKILLGIIRIHESHGSKIVVSFLVNILNLGYFEFFSTQVQTVKMNCHSYQNSPET